MIKSADNSWIQESLTFNEEHRKPADFRFNPSLSGHSPCILLTALCYPPGFRSRIQVVTPHKENPFFQYLCELGSFTFQHIRPHPYDIRYNHTCDDRLDDRNTHVDGGKEGETCKDL